MAVEQKPFKYKKKVASVREYIKAQGDVNENACASIENIHAAFSKLGFRAALYKAVDYGGKMYWENMAPDLLFGNDKITGASGFYTGVDADGAVKYNDPEGPMFETYKADYNSWPNPDMDSGETGWWEVEKGGQKWWVADQPELGWDNDKYMRTAETKKVDGYWTQIFAPGTKEESRKETCGTFYWRGQGCSQKPGYEFKIAYDQTISSQDAGDIQELGATWNGEVDGQKVAFGLAWLRTQTFGLLLTFPLKDYKNFPARSLKLNPAMSAAHSLFEDVHEVLTEWQILQ